MSGESKRERQERNQRGAATSIAAQVAYHWRRHEASGGGGGGGGDAGLFALALILSDGTSAAVRVGRLTLI